MTGRAAERGDAEDVGTEVAAIRSQISPAVSTVRVVYPDLHGIQRGKDVPIAELDRTARSGLGFCWAVMGTDLAHTPVVGGEEGYPDMVARPDLSTLVELPWEPDVVCCLADLERDEEPEPTDQRGLVRRAEAALAELGLTAKIGPELEFFLLEPDEQGGWRRHVDNLSMVYTVGPQADPQGIFRGLVEACAALGIGAIAGNHEYMNSQYEINLREAAPLIAADNAFRFKAAVKDYSAQRGLLATFMGKPFNDQGGSGTHMHISLEREGSNCMHDPDADAGLSDELRHFVAGVLDHAGALMAFLNPTINAYRRIVPDSLAPTHGNWGLNNRTTFVRIPPERGPACRLEIRVGDGAANPYLITAAILFAGLDGLRRELDPPAPLEGDTYTLPEEEQGTDVAAVAGRGPRRARSRQRHRRGRRRRHRQHLPGDEAVRDRAPPGPRLRLGPRRVHAPPLRDGARRGRSHRPRSLRRARAARDVRDPAPRGSRPLAGGVRRPRLLGGHQPRRHHRDRKGLAHLLLRARRHLAAGPRARSDRGAQVDDRHGPAAAQQAARDRQPRFHPARGTHLHRAHPRALRPRAR